MAKGGSSYKIKLSSGMRPYVGRVVRNGRIQRAFASQIGRPVGACVKQNVRVGMGAGQIKAAVSDCAKRLGRVPLGGIGRRFEGTEG
jgi:hypothetical protein